SEGCLSSPDEYGLVTRPMNVTVKALDRNGKEYTVSGEGLLARAFCHEIDHLDGILFKDIASEMVDLEETHQKKAVRVRRRG
ncbi:MAG: peptide deformylase, partial [Oscillospiraceae bacterium]